MRGRERGGVREGWREEGRERKTEREREREGCVGRGIKARDKEGRVKDYRESQN